MRLALELFATLAPFLPPDARSDGTATLEIGEAATVQNVLERLGIPPALACIALVNGHDATPGQLLHDGDVVSLFPPLAGGG